MARPAGWFFLLASAGCSGFAVSSPAELLRFEAAGPYRPEVDEEALLGARRAFLEPYQVAAGDILQFEMPQVMRALAADPGAAVRPHVARVSSEGKVTLPLIGELAVGGLTLEEAERAAVAAYHPRYSVQLPAIVATVREHNEVKVAVQGAVMKPGIHALASDERSLVGALMKAGGLHGSGARAVRITRQAAGGAAAPPAPPLPLVLPVDGMNVAFADVALEGGESIDVLSLDPQVFTVLGLVNKQGTYPYPAGARLSLLDAIGTGGGIDRVARPHYVQVFRQDWDGEVVAATFDLDGDGFLRAASLPIKPGDIVALGDTPMTDFRQAVAGLFRGGVNVLLRYDLSDEVNGNSRSSR